MSNWTPGPWKLWGMQVCSAAPQFGGSEKQTNDSDVVATTYQRDANGQAITADAALIAAAPELYAALKELFDALEGARAANPEASIEFFEELVEIEPGWRGQIRALLAKVERKETA